MTYRIRRDHDGSESIVREADGAFVPKDEANRDYEAFKQWLADGNAPTVEQLPAPRAADDADRMTLRKLIRLLIRRNLITVAQVRAALDDND